MQNAIKSTLNVAVGTTQIEQVHEHKTLGLIIDQHLTFNSHVLSLTKLTAQKVYQLSKIKHFLDEHSRMIFYKAHIESHIDYCSTIWDRCAASCIERLHSLHRRAIRLIAGKQNIQNSCLYENLHLLPISKRFLLNKAKFVHKILSQNAPQYLTPLFTTMDSHTKRLHRLYIPMPRLDLFKKSFLYSGAHLWNSLPNSLKIIESPYSFNRHLFNYIIKSNYKPP